MQDYVAPRPLAVRTCAAAGTKFYDLNANGRRDRGEPGIPRFLIWADYNHDGQRQANEPFSVTDNRGRYVIEDIQPPGGDYTLRETLPSAEPRARHGLGLLISTRRHPRRLCQRPRGPVRLRLGPDRQRRHALCAGP